MPPRSAPPERLHQLGAALSVPNFRRYVSGQALSLVGTWIETVTQGLLVLRLTHSGVLLGLTTATRYAPVLLLSPSAGLMVDRFPKRRVLLVTQLGLGLVSLVLGLAVLTDEVRLWQVFVLGIAFGTFSAADNPARQAFVSEVVGPALIRNAVTLNSTLVNVARVLGPAIAAVVVGSLGIGWCFVINAVSFLAVIVTLLVLDAADLHPMTPTPRARGQLRAGLHYATGIPQIMRPLLMMAVIGTFTFEFEVSFPLLARDTFHGGADAYGWLLGAFGVGAVAGGLYALGRPKTGVARLARIAVGYAAAMALLAIAPTMWTAVCASVLVGAATISFLTTGNSTVQLASDPHYRGRVMALWSAALVGSTPIGAPIIGAVSQALDPRAAIGLGALACAVAAAIGRTAPSRAPHRAATELPARHAILSSRSHPSERPDDAAGAAHRRRPDACGLTFARQLIAGLRCRTRTAQRHTYPHLQRPGMTPLPRLVAAWWSQPASLGRISALKNSKKPLASSPIWLTNSSSNPASRYGRNASRCRAGSGPQGTTSATISSVTTDDASSKWRGMGSSWESSPERASVGQSSNALRRAFSSSGPKQTFVTATAGPRPPADRYRSTCSPSGLVVTKPSPNRAAAAIELSPNPETKIGGR